MSAELEQRRRNVRVMDLLTEAYNAFASGDVDTARARYEAAFEHDAQAATVITGGMRTGDVPRPEANPSGWAEYLEANRDALARLEATETGGVCPICGKPKDELHTRATIQAHREHHAETGRGDMCPAPNAHDMTKQFAVCHKCGATIRQGTSGRWYAADRLEGLGAPVCDHEVKS